MIILLCIIALHTFEQDINTFEVCLETSSNVLKFTPRWTLESYPGNHIILFNRLTCSYSPFCVRGVYIGAEFGFVNRFHSTYFYSYNSYGVDDTHIWLQTETIGTIAFLGKFGLPTGNYIEGLGNGAYWIELYLKRKEFLGKGNVYLGYEWIGKNPDNVDYGDKIHFALDMNRWLRISSYYALADRGEDFPLYDSPSFSLGVTISKDFVLSKTYNLKLAFNQNLLGKDIDVVSSFFLTIAKKRKISE